MADKTKIEWTDATWNPITGCSVVSPGCTNCYAMRLAGTRLKHHPTRKDLTTMSKAGPVWNGEVRFNEKALMDPLRWTRPRMIFVCAHGDLFAENVPDKWIDKVFAVMAAAHWHTFQVLTKRPERMRSYLSTVPREFPISAAQINLPDEVDFEGRWPHLPLPNVWLGVSVEDQKRADERIPELLKTRAAVRFVSAEPLLGAIDLNSILGGTLWIGGQRGCEGKHQHNGHRGETIHGILHDSDPRKEHHHHDERCRRGLDWVIAGGESGPGARPMHPDWARSLRDQCASAGVPFFFKQWGNWMDLTKLKPTTCAIEERVITRSGKVIGVGVDYGQKGIVDHDWREQGGAWMGRVSKKFAGRLLDGIEHNAMPDRASGA